ncbi:hypothetical protein EV649_4529 [Kribbella sp. VKM Ac-2569]|uniref:hypothetical protein n=1 Tax=Kribbella sp. VKM Ac-2569 TaxID=2512220 RepID=UPI00102B3A35|nr:hypothetical protein [Kribbella sp. VKM Ac-2569]RZT16992.1 hypothetical protein EV649_4529 [Kribbella sp. VKM Ac-2569]
MGTENEEELYKRQQMDERLRVQEQTRQQQEALAKFREAEAARKAAEDAAKKSSMVADPAAGGVSWPDNEVQAAPQTGMDKVAGALRVGQAGDVAFARDLLNSGQAPLGGVAKPEQAADGAKESPAGSRAAKPALGLG